MSLLIQMAGEYDSDSKQFSLLMYLSIKILCTLFSVNIETPDKDFHQINKFHLEFVPKVTIYEIRAAMWIKQKKWRGKKDCIDNRNEKTLVPKPA